jgi:hypothetical protein
MRIFNFRFFGILEICFSKTKSTDAHMPKTFSAEKLAIKAVTWIYV